ncbi:MAG: hypothetical protein II202_04055, partial [Bacteroidales bacterium]|nr:hypothetical protein [Bacteroidales bacterium]
MKRALLFAVMLVCALQATAQKWVRVNTVGYLPDDIKVAVYISTEPSDEKTF